MKIFWAILCVGLTSCSYFSKEKRGPASVAGPEMLGLSKQAQNIIDKVATRELNAQNCQVELDALIDLYGKIPLSLDLENIKAQGEEILDQHFNARMAVHSIIDLLPRDCRVKIKDLYSKMRMVEDLVGVYYYPDPQILVETINYEKIPVPVYDKSAYRPYRLGEGLDPEKKFEFQNGDIMITKGVSFISSTISELATPKSLYSHIVFVHVDEKTKKVSTIESYVGRGVNIFPIEEALKNENARILVLRAKNTKLASEAANYMYDRVTKLKEKNEIILYDYKLDFSNNKTMSCEEVAYDAFKTSSKGQFIIPDIESEILLDEEDFLDHLGVKKGPIMVPADMETDPRFDIVLDWTDYRVMRDSWRKDIILGELFKRIEREGSSLYTTTMSRAAQLVWATRGIPGVWNMVSKLAGIPADFTKDVPGTTIGVMASIKSLGEKMFNKLTKKEEAYFKENGKWMTRDELKRTIREIEMSERKPGFKKLPMESDPIH